VATTQSAAPFHKYIHRWYVRHQRHLPWRRTRNPYRILLSEIMAQQTQVSRVADYYKRWIKSFPTFSSLANATTGDVLRKWSGLGYNSRALRFHQLAKIVTTEFHSRLPSNPDDLQKLPGIGRYTAHAVACFAFEQDVPVVDVNIRRVITRWTKKVVFASEQVDDDRAWILAEKFLPSKRAYSWNQSLMDFGALVCTARNPGCDRCPVSSYCASAFSKSFLLKEKKKIKNEPEWRGIPRRLYRGKILKLLHHHSSTAEDIAALLWKRPTQADISWTELLMEKMKNDGLLSFRKGKYALVQ